MNTKTVYKYDDNKYYVDTQKSYESPLEKGVYLLPANCTEIEPLVSKDGFTQKFNGTAWEYERLPYDEYCYYNNGLSYKTVKSTYTVQDGEVLFETTPTEEQLKSAFSGYETAKLAAAQNTKITILQGLLTRTDYQAIKYAEGVITATQFANLKAARIAWRTAIDTIQACTTVDAVNAVTYNTDIPSVD